jgi:hypothetical protein
LYGTQKAQILPSYLVQFIFIDIPHWLSFRGAGRAGEAILIHQIHFYPRDPCSIALLVYGTPVLGVFTDFFEFFLGCCLGDTMHRVSTAG